MDNSELYTQIRGICGEVAGERGKVKKSYPQFMHKKSILNVNGHLFYNFCTNSEKVRKNYQQKGKHLFINEKNLQKYVYEGKNH